MSDGISVILRTADYRGDHAADVGIAYEVNPGETVEGLVDRLIGQNSNVDPSAECIELRIVRQQRAWSPAPRETGDQR